MTFIEKQNESEAVVLVEASEGHSAVMETDSHKYHHSQSGKEHSRHHSSKWRRYKRKFSWFIKKNKQMLINIAVIVLALAVFVVFAMYKHPQYEGLEDTAYPQTGLNENTGTRVTASSIQIEVPLFTGEVSLITGPARAFLNRDLSVPLKDAIQQYRKEGERQDIGLPVTLSYEVIGMPIEYSVASATIEVSETLSFAAPRVYTLKSEERSVDVYYLKTNTQYYYRISLTLSDGSVTSVQGSFKTADTLRILSIEGLVNVRDIGGWKTTDGRRIRQGLLYRGSELDGAVQSSYSITANGLNNMLTVFGIRTDMDLRAPIVNVHGTDALGANVEHIYYNSPQYAEIFREDKSVIVRRIFADLADSEKYPVYLHCTYGKDRTGTICYLLEALLGVDESSLLRDYELSALFHNWFDSERVDEFVAELKALEGETMQEKVEGYLMSIGVTAEEIANIKDIFLEG